MPTQNGSFSDLFLPPALDRAVATLGFDKPTEIQAQAVPVLLDGSDVTGVAQTGTGKTLAFGLPLLARFADATEKNPAPLGLQALVLAPTRELALQVTQSLQSVAQHLPGVQLVTVYGGSPYPPQLRALRQGAQVVVGTPGRVIDLIEKGALDLSAIQYLVLDEADEMLRMGFAEDVDRILRETPRGRQTALFSATMPPAIRRVAKSHLHDPVEISVTPPASTVETIDQTYAVVPHRFKATALSRVIATAKAEAAIIFVRTRIAAEEVATNLTASGTPAVHLSGDVPQQDRERIIARLRDGTVNVLVATDVAARGLDVQRIGLVVNADLPTDPQTYVHRIGRTGRAGRTGTALTLVTPGEERKISVIERATKSQIRKVPVPGVTDVIAFRATAELARAVEVKTAPDISNTLTAAINKALVEHNIEPEQLFLNLLAQHSGAALSSDSEHLELDEAVGRLTHGPDTGVRGQRGGAAARSNSARITTYRISVGHTDGVQPGQIVGAFTNEGRIAGSDLGRIQIYPNFSLVQVPDGLDEQAMRRLSKTQIDGRRLQIRLDDGPPSSGKKGRPRAEGPGGSKYQGGPKSAPYGKRSAPKSSAIKGGGTKYGAKPAPKGGKKQRGY